METKSGAPPMLSCDEFEPFCTWRREEGRETLVVHLPEFRKEQLKVQISNLGFLKISGERPAGALKLSRFYREIRLPKDCITTEIHAKFIGGLLHIAMPKNTSLVTKEAQPPALVQQSHVIQDQDSKPKIGQDQVTNKPTITEAGSAEKKIKSSENATNNNEFQQEYSVLRLKSFTYKAINLAVVVAVVSALNAYFVYKLCRPPS